MDLEAMNQGFLFLKTKPKIKEIFFLIKKNPKLRPKIPIKTKT
jgi:hypothetical protein